MPSLKRKRTPASRPPITPRTSGRQLGHRVPASQAFSISSGPRTPVASSANQLHTPFPTETKIETDRSVRATDDDLDDHVITAIDMKDHGTVGCSYYSAEEEKMYLLGDSRSGDIETIDARGLIIVQVYIGSANRAIFSASSDKTDSGLDTSTG